MRTYTHADTHMQVNYLPKRADSALFLYFLDVIEFFLPPRLLSFMTCCIQGHDLTFKQIQKS